MTAAMNIETDQSLVENGKGVPVEIRPTSSSTEGKLHKKNKEKFKVTNFNISTYLSKYFYW